MPHPCVLYAGNGQDHQHDKQINISSIFKTIFMGHLYLGDNLAILRDMETESVDLICTDPPFNTKRDWGAFTDKWQGGLKGYLNFMKPRLEQMHRLLKPTGSLYLHCNAHASHYLKVMLDGIFGIRNFKNEIVCRAQSGASNTARRKYAADHAYILFYTKSNQHRFKTQYNPFSAEQLKGYRKIDADGRRYRINSSGGRRKTCGRTRTYLDTLFGKRIGTLWLETGLALASCAKERLGYPTQKSLKLYERIIKASSNQGDIVLDPFCGSGTTLDAAKRLGRDYIGIDRNPEAIEICERRLDPPQLTLEL